MSNGYSLYDKPNQTKPETMPLEEGVWFLTLIQEERKKLKEKTCPPQVCCQFIPARSQ